MSAATKRPTLPEGILASDLEPLTFRKTRPYGYIDEPKGLGYEDPRSFELWYTERFGSSIPTLGISASRRGAAYAPRTYGVTIDGKLVRMGAGPHVLARCTVYLRASRQAALAPFLELRLKGLSQAGETRDTISTRRAQGALRRRSWGF